MYSPKSPGHPQGCNCHSPQSQTKSETKKPNQTPKGNKIVQPLKLENEFMNIEFEENQLKVEVEVAEEAIEKLDLSAPCDIAKKSLESGKETSKCIKMKQTGECVAHGSTSSADGDFTVVENPNINLSGSEIELLREQFDINDEMEDEVFG